ncbi:peroxisomal membrane protein PEX14 [Hylaeus anthracinus]|uniref:peroxisomal membrane protein PEX14 n=1 Tax=Hylaeus volcanicus TaxID=313075 RepID=UPI0023B8203E|nr:peroxisomal membrane protein PEX14 [Hylaeus volcanicus]XP_053983011.1 peroxisomal membrane protein PEX14 [Hylaeus volcanicus]XP_053999234.1 peroxisomal membrane protein PEX14 [Hylaeus anthracinus]XP_053999235.1 peroxisomal membrane protein PEX14 [Hylaeus anthracinus]
MAMTDQDANNNNLPLRENLVKTAVEFLQNPKVTSSPVGRKQEFLRRKGLTEEEIQTAFKLASVDTTADQNVIHKSKDYTVIPISPGHVHPYFQTYPYQITLFQKVKEFFNATALIGATIYCVYWFYKKFIEPFLFGRKKKNTITDSVSELDKTIQNSMKEVKQSISKVEDDVQKLTQNQSLDPMVPQLVQELKQDLASLKSLLLSRKQFPSAPASIPSWQLDAAATNQEKPSEGEDDAGSGSSANVSDSSLEMIREDPPKE